MGADPQISDVSDVARFRGLLDREAAAIERTLADHPRVSDPRSGVEEHKELRRQLCALRERVALAHSEYDDPRALRVELATFWSFAKTLRRDAETWRRALEQRLKERERAENAARQARERLAADREELMRRRDALQLAIVETAEAVAQRNDGECRRTLPVLTLDDDVTVCSVTVDSRTRGFRSAKRWLVTLNDSRDEVLVRRD